MKKRPRSLRESGVRALPLAAWLGSVCASPATDTPAPFAVFGTTPSTTPKPNVILIMTDDQGYGEIAGHGKSIIKTAHMPQLHASSVRPTDFHVEPTLLQTWLARPNGKQYGADYTSIRFDNGGLNETGNKTAH